MTAPRIKAGDIQAEIKQLKADIDQLKTDQLVGSHSTRLYTAQSAIIPISLAGFGSLVDFVGFACDGFTESDALANNTLPAADLSVRVYTDSGMVNELHPDATSYPIVNGGSNVIDEFFFNHMIWLVTFQNRSASPATFYVVYTVQSFASGGTVTA